MKLMTRLQCSAGTALLMASFGVCAASPSGASDSDALVQQGKYLATAGDCIACHTAPGGKPFAGGLALPTPIGDIISTNITPSKTHGIGTYTLEQFTKAVREGVKANGDHEYPAMPYTSYAKVSDADIQAMYAYFMKEVEPVDTAPAATDLPFPFNIRFSMAAWNLLFLDKKVYEPIPDKGEVWNRGAYLAQGLTHCSTCHTPRNMLMAENFSLNLAGGEVGPWHAPNITSDINSGIGGWSDQEIIDYLRTGNAGAKGQAAGPMAEAVDHSLQHLNEADLKAIAVYLKTVPAIANSSNSRPAYAWGAAADDLKSIRGVPLPADLNQMTGPQLYDAECASCHQAQGQGTKDGLPSLFHNTALGTTKTDNLVLVILEGIPRLPGTPGAIMPAFKTQLSDQQIATLGTYLISNYGNPQATITTDQVKSLRSGQSPNSTVDLVWLARAGIVGGGIIVLLIIGFLVRRSRKRHQ